MKFLFLNNKCSVHIAYKKEKKVTNENKGGKIGFIIYTLDILFWFVQI
jgi:hypothetical protein